MRNKRDSDGSSTRGSLRIVSSSESEAPAMEPTIAVIGGGFSGVAVAAQLLRRNRPGRVMLVNRFGPIGRGVAYRTRLEAHVLNVPARGMSGLPDDPFALPALGAGRNGRVAPDTFVSRRQYGEYLEFLLRESEGAAPRGTTLERVIGEVCDIEPDRRGRHSVLR